MRVPLRKNFGNREKKISILSVLLQVYIYNTKLMSVQVESNNYL